MQPFLTTYRSSVPADCCTSPGMDPPKAAAPRSPEAAGLPNQTAGTVDVYGLQILDATLEANTVEEDTAASALLLKHEFLDGGANDVTLATLGKVLEPTLTTLANFLVRSNSELRGLGQLRGGRLPAGGPRHDPKRLRLEHRAHLHADAGETLLLWLPVPAGHGLHSLFRGGFPNGLYST